ncbi:MAG: aminomethyl-transferring glycine dehydrogenase subunit GcvPA [Kiritimatiellaeota bacterium]|nr:aminomethyl-transferring glycine dehydrogenase subunit GcvPA [Kiritimatiellota bacterium]
MLDSIGVKHVDDLFRDIPADLRLAKLNLPAGKSQQEVSDIFRDLAAQNKTYRTILRGAGAYHHYTPPAVKNLLQRSEFLTAYTPYQPELSQGILQSIFEYQTMICSLTGMDATNASVYSGATAAADAVLMCENKAGRNRVIISDNIKPDTLEVIKTYARARGMTVDVVAPVNGLFDIQAFKEKAADSACVYFEQPNYFGLIEDAETICAAAHEAGAKAIMGVNPTAAALLKSAGECGADFAVGDAQCLGLPLSFGGPYIGFIAATAKETRKLNGRIVGETTDKNGRRAFVLTLQAREQHIRREKALSNICSNQAFCALAVAMYLAAMGPQGLREVATTCVSMAHYAAQRMVANGAKLKYGGEFFHEFVTIHDAKSADIINALDKENILGGLPVGEHEILWCFTETATKQAVDKALDIISLTGKE